MAEAVTAQRIPFNSRVLKWARERRHFAVENAARKVNVRPEQVIQWETGAASPTVRQARILADFYDRPFLEFFARDIPNVPETELVPDFRSYRGEVPLQEDDILREIHRWAEEVRLNALDLIEAIGERPPELSREIFATVDDDVEAVANRVRSIVGPTTDKQFSLTSKDRYQFPQIVRQAFERSGVIVLKSNLGVVRTRGICLFANPLPVVIFGNESPGAQAFTLAHEMAHIVLKQSAISGPPRFGGHVGAKRVEGWCNQFAAAYLMPGDCIAADMKDVKTQLASLTDDRLRYMANRYAVSKHAMLIRLVSLGYVKASYYWFVKRPQFIKEEDEYEGGGRSLYYGSRYRSSHGDLYTGLVLEAWNNGIINNHNAAEFMGIKNLTHLNDIRSNFGR